MTASKVDRVNYIKAQSTTFFAPWAYPAESRTKHSDTKRQIARSGEEPRELSADVEQLPDVEDDAGGGGYLAVNDENGLLFDILF